MLNDDTSLVCPITHELFRDLVKAEDGRLYEREAIIQWINQNGTSPFTRQTLSINQLQPDEHIKKKANQRRALSVTYNRDSDQVELPPIRRASNIHFVNKVVDIRHFPESNVSSAYPSIPSESTHVTTIRCFIICILTVIVVLGSFAFIFFTFFILTLNFIVPYSGSHV